MRRPPGPYQTFDYIVVGAGSAGCVLANRLSANPRNDVLLVESGGRDHSPWIHVPIGCYRTAFRSGPAWRYRTEPDPGIDNRSIGWPRGRVLGGTSAINGMLYVRGQPQDFDHWRQLGNQGWGWEDVLPLFKEAEDQARGADDLHGVGGPLAVSDLPMRLELCEAYIRAAEETGLPRNDDFNGARQEGAGYYQLTTRRGRRWSTAVGYLRPARRRPNLRVVTRAHVSRIVFEDRRAVGVAYRHRGTERTAGAGREIVLSAGAINSPQVMQLSGLGPGELLRRHGIEVLKDIPGVGENLQDHYQVRSIYRCTRPITLNDCLRNPLRKLAMAAEYLLFRKGFMAVAAAQVGVFARARPASETPDVQFHITPGSTDDPAKGMHRFSGFTASVCQLRPQSRGTLRIRSKEAEEPPAIHADYLTERADKETAVAGLRLARRISRAPALAAYVAGEYQPGETVEGDSDLLAFARAKGTTVFHPVGTCKMGSDPGAVVDDRLRVRGIAGLRIADASIMPTLVSGNTNAACVMIGEKAAKMMSQGGLTGAAQADMRRGTALSRG